MDVKGVKVIYFRSEEPFQEIEDFVVSCEDFYQIKISRLTTDRTMKEMLTRICKEDTDIEACIMGSRRTDPYCENLKSFDVGHLIEFYFCRFFNHKNDSEFRNLMTNKFSCSIFRFTYWQIIFGVLHVFFSQQTEAGRSSWESTRCSIGIVPMSGSTCWPRKFRIAHYMIGDTRRLAIEAILCQTHTWRKLPDHSYQPISFSMTLWKGLEESLLKNSRWRKGAVHGVTT